MLFETHITDITRVIQLAIAPVFLLTAIGTFITALNIRLSRAVDRRRALDAKLPSANPEEIDSINDELLRIAHRIRFVYLSIVLAVICALLICLLIASVFIGFFLTVDLSRVIALLFILAMLALIGCLTTFLREIFLAVMTTRRLPR